MKLQKAQEVERGYLFVGMELEEKIKLLRFKKTELEKRNNNIRENKLKLEELNQINKDYTDYIRFLHNEYQEAKGNIRVFCRVRPLLQKENFEQNNSFKYIEYLSQNSFVINHPIQKSNTGKAKEVQNKETFRFDRVFTPDDTQDEIFKEISQLVRSALDGYKVCIFAYGQTGSGKTFTMQGDRERPGIIPKSVIQIFDEKKELEKAGWKFNLEVSYLEIYIDQVRDLLLNSSNYIISQNNKIGTASATVINNIEEMNMLFETATKKRVVAETQCNDRSSRSHLIFQLKISAKNSELKMERNGALNLIDLAGSERISKSKVEDERLKESIAINKSLTALKSVITALVNSNSHIPYRSSILTNILQQHLGGDSKTLMFVNISPLVSNLGETINSLKFALDVNNCVLKE